MYPEKNQLCAFFFHVHNGYLPNAPVLIIAFSVSFLIAWRLLVIGSAERRYFDPLCCLIYPTARRWWMASIGSLETWCVPEHSPPTMEKSSGNWRVHREHDQGRSQMTTPRQDVFHVLLPRRNRMSTARALKFTSTVLLKFNVQTVMYKLH